MATTGEEVELDQVVRSAGAITTSWDHDIKRPQCDRCECISTIRQLFGFLYVGELYMRDVCGE